MSVLYWILGIAFTAFVGLCWLGRPYPKRKPIKYLGRIEEWEE